MTHINNSGPIFDLLLYWASDRPASPFRPVRVLLQELDSCDFTRLSIRRLARDRIASGSGPRSKWVMRCGPSYWRSPVGPLGPFPELDLILLDELDTCGPNIRPTSAGSCPPFGEDSISCSSAPTPDSCPTGDSPSLSTHVWDQVIPSCCDTRPYLAHAERIRQPC